MYHYLTVCKQMSSDSFKNAIYKLYAYKSYDIYKEDLALNNLQCHQTKSNARR